MKNLNLTDQHFNFIRKAIKEYEYQDEEESKIYYEVLEILRHTAAKHYCQATTF